VVLVRQFGIHLKNLLIYDRVSEAVQNFCANHTIDEVYNTKFLDIQDYVNVALERSLDRFAPNNSITIWNVFLPKPDVPPAIAENYREVKVTGENPNPYHEIWTIVQSLLPQNAQVTDLMHDTLSHINT
jgi:hypothetical protein